MKRRERLRGTFRAIFTRDLVTPIFKIELRRVTENSYIAETKAIHRYPGPHEIGVVCAQRVGNPIARNGEIELHISWDATKGNWTKQREATTDLSVPWYDGDNNGFSLIQYSVPDEVPIGEELICRIAISDRESLLRTYQPSAVFARNITMP